jgi:serine protease Do
MIGVNVAVRAGAQGIGFAIPIDQALRTAARLLNVQRLQGKWHGVVTQPGQATDEPLQVTKVESASPGETCGLQPGDQIVRVGSSPVARPLDLERALLDRPVGVPVPVEVRRNQQTLLLELALAESPLTTGNTRTALSSNDPGTWNVLGLRLTEEPRATFASRRTRYRGGMHVDDVRPNSPAAREGIQAGDILVGMHRRETASEQDIQYILSRPNFTDMGKIKFYVLRGQNTLYGHLNVAANADTATAGSVRR